MFITQERNFCLTNISHNPSQWGFISSEPSVGGFLDVYVRPDWDWWAPDCWRGTTINIWARGHAVSRWVGIHTCGSPCAVSSRRREQRPDPRGRCPLGWGALQEIPRSGCATKGNRRWLQQRSVQILNYLATILQRLINADILRILPQRTSTRTLDRDRSTPLPYLPLPIPM